MSGVPSSGVDVFELGSEHEQVVFCNDRATGLRAIIAIHSTALGPALGGTRFYPYASTDDAIIAMGEIAGRSAEEVALKVARHYLRGRTTEGLLDLFREGLAKVGVLDVPGYDTELAALEALVPHAQDGDVLALMCHAERTEVDGWIRTQGGTVDDARTIRRKVVAARGEHELESEIAALWQTDDEL